MSGSVIPLIINGAEVVTDKLQAVSDPSGHELSPASCLTDVEAGVVQLAETSLIGMAKWREVLFLDKKEVFERAKKLALERYDELRDAHMETGAPEWFANFNVSVLNDFIDEYGAKLSLGDGEIVKLKTTKLALVFNEPIGPVLAVSPWNAPVILCSRSILAPLAAGCSVVVKLSEKCPRAAYLLVRLFLDAGVPKETLQLAHTTVQDTPQFVDSMLKNDIIKKINFTGSTQVGRIIAGVAAKYLKPCLLELGGKNVTIIEADADLDAAVAKTLWSSWCHQGQICMSTDIVYVHDAIFDEFKNKLQTVAEEVTKGPQFNDLVRDSIQASKIKFLIDDAIEKGATLVFPKVGLVSENTPAILGDITNDMAISYTETFGPVFSIARYVNTSELIGKLNTSPFGLKASIWSKDLLKALDYARQLEVGGVHINLPTVHDEATVPHGGAKLSGFGRFNSRWGVQEFQMVKTVTMS